MGEAVVLGRARGGPGEGREQEEGPEEGFKPVMSPVMSGGGGGGYHAVP